MPTPRSQLLAQSSLSPDLNSRADADWQAAQERYNAGINAGYSPADARALYLQPIASKWKIIASSPQLVQDKGQLDKFSQQFDDAMAHFHNNINQSGQSMGAAADYGGSINPTLEKWSAIGSLPAAEPDASEVTQDQMGALKEVQDGYNPVQVLQGHKVDLWNPTFQNRFYTEALRAGADKNKSAATDEKKNAPATLRAERFRLADQLKQATDNGSPGIAAAYQDELNKLDSQITNGVPQANPDWQFTPPDAAPSQGNNAPAADVAAEIQNEHPDWTNAQVSLAGQGKLSGAKSAVPANVPTINSQKDYDALPAGAQYMDSNGKLAVKKSAK